MKHNRNDLTSFLHNAEFHFGAITGVARAAAISQLTDLLIESKIVANYFANQLKVSVIF